MRTAAHRPGNSTQAGCDPGLRDLCGGDIAPHDQTGPIVRLQADDVRWHCVMGQRRVAGMGMWGQKPAGGNNDDRLKLRGRHPSEASMLEKQTSLYSLPCSIL